MRWNVVLLASGWLMWCALHSLLIFPSVSSKLQSLLGIYRFYYRFLYNCVAVVTLMPIMIFTAVMPGELIFAWQGGWTILRIVLSGIALMLFWDGAKHYDFGYFIGFRQILERRQLSTLAPDGQFSRRGSLGLTRHPWYLGSLLLLWSALSTYHLSSVVAAAVLSIYLFVGTLLEERKLVALHGDAYRNYQLEVSMLVPLKWLKKRLLGRG